ncbi:MAG: citrate lyase holo-[acyl-carrier protein] synthase [Cloacibacillus sp.]|nr:citrate lyase holo-[acyl-carrier protein] synthase [Cloacibacillus sp.]
MGLPERRCLLCGERAKVCARLGSHPQSELREKVIRIINAAALEM